MIREDQGDLPRGLSGIIARYGDALAYVDAPVAWERLILEPVPVPAGLLLFVGLPVTSMRVHKLARPRFAAAMRNLVSLGLSAIDYGGTYLFRAKRTNPAHLSTHAWGIAVDINPSRCPLGCDPKLQDSRVVAAFRSAGFAWGGNYHGTPDAMHFELCEDY